MVTSAQKPDNLICTYIKDPKCLKLDVQHMQINQASS